MPIEILMADGLGLRIGRDPEGKATLALVMPGPQTQLVITLRNRTVVRELRDMNQLIAVQRLTRPPRSRDKSRVISRADGPAGHLQFLEKIVQPAGEDLVDAVVGKPFVRAAGQPFGLIRISARHGAADRVERILQQPRLKRTERGCRESSSRSSATFSGSI